MTERISPKTFYADENQVKASPEQKSNEVARVQNIDPNTCPICSNLLTRAKANGHNVGVCGLHNIVMPVKD